MIIVEEYDPVFMRLVAPASSLNFTDVFVPAGLFGARELEIVLSTFDIESQHAFTVSPEPVLQEVPLSLYLATIFVPSGLKPKNPSVDPTLQVKSGVPGTTGE